MRNSPRNLLETEILPVELDKSVCIQPCLLIHIKKDLTEITNKKGLDRHSITFCRLYFKKWYIEEDDLEDLLMDIGQPIDGTH